MRMDILLYFYFLMLVRIAKIKYYSEASRLWTFFPLPDNLFTASFIFALKKFTIFIAEFHYHHIYNVFHMLICVMENWHERTLGLGDGLCQQPQPCMERLAASQKLMPNSLQTQVCGIQPHHVENNSIRRGVLPVLLSIEIGIECIFT